MNHSMPDYTRISRLGGGGFGEVWHCTNARTGADVAMKVLLDPENEAARNRFSREVRILASLEHPNIVRVLDRSLTEAPFFTMPLYRHSLEAVMGSVAGELDRIVSIYTRILDAVKYAHDQGVIHRDLKPGNILLNNDTDVVVSDFGLGRRFDAVTTRQTMTGFGMGTPDYMAPEQIRDARNADERADLFSLGKILYEMFTGDGPGGTLEIDRLPPRFRPIITRCTRNNRDERYDSVDDLRTAWRLATDPDSIRYRRTSVGGILGKMDDGLTDELAAELAQSLSDVNDPDLIHEVFMELNDDVLAAMWSKAQAAMRHLVGVFTEFVANGG